MKHRLILSALAVVLFATSGCGLFSKKSARQKDNGAIASEVEESLKRRWIEKRLGELTAQGLTADAAREQATQEFRQKFEYTQAAKK